MDNNGKLDYRAISVMDATFRFRVKRLETDFIFADGSVQTFSNWDIKGVRERHYMEEYVVVSVEEYLRVSLATGDIVEFGIAAADVKKFIEGKFGFFEDLLLEAAANTPLDAEV